MLLEHRGEWRTDGWIIEGEKRTPVKAKWECKAAVNGVGNVCTWYHEWVDRPHDPRSTSWATTRRQGVEDPAGQ